ncbi:MAG: hypothetical protein L0387_44360 [Acidobacteria bacterium]|nr:hypothetical protein [Acidobacteriota bacterium]
MALEWELAVLSGLARLGSIRYELNLGGKTRPDILFQTKTQEQGVAIDITTVSDKGLHKRNPIDAFLDELKRRTLVIKEKGVVGGFIVDVRSDWSGVLHRAPVNLKLPTIRRFQEVVFNTGFNCFIKQILKNPASGHVYEVKTSDVDLRIGFDPRAKGVSSSAYASCTAPYSKSRNPIARAMKSKMDQLKRSEFPGPLGIVICDGDCNMLHSTMYGRWHGTSFSVEDIVADFFGRYSSLSFVMALTIRLRSIMEMSVGPDNLEYWPRIFLNPKMRYTVLEGFTKCLQKLPQFLPAPMRTPLNARCLIEWKRKTGQWFEDISLEGGLVMKDSTIKLSARAVLDLFSGLQDPEQFFKRHHLHELNPFLMMRRKGRLIANVRVEKSNIPENDDEWLVFEFGEPDAAVSPFRVQDAL